MATMSKLVIPPRFQVLTTIISARISCGKKDSNWLSNQVEHLYRKCDEHKLLVADVVETVGSAWKRNPPQNMVNNVYSLKHCLVAFTFVHRFSRNIETGTSSMKRMIRNGCMLVFFGDDFGIHAESPKEDFDLFYKKLREAEESSDRTSKRSHEAALKRKQKKAIELTNCRLVAYGITDRKEKNVMVMIRYCFECIIDRESLTWYLYRIYYGLGWKIPADGIFECNEWMVGEDYDDLERSLYPQEIADLLNVWESTYEDQPWTGPLVELVYRQYQKTCGLPLRKIEWDIEENQKGSNSAFPDIEVEIPRSFRRLRRCG